VQAGLDDDPAELALYVPGAQARTGPGREHQVVVLPLATDGFAGDDLLLPQAPQCHDASLREFEHPAGLDGLGIATAADRAPHVDRELLVSPTGFPDGRPCIPVRIEGHQVRPGEAAKILGPSAGQQRQCDVRA
jgi:hypothetical protein